MFDGETLPIRPKLSGLAANTPFYIGCRRLCINMAILLAYDSCRASTHSPRSASLWWNQNVAPKSKGNHKATAQEPARTSVSSPPTFVPLLTTEELCILLPMSFQRERTRLMKLKTFIFLLVNKPPS